MNERILLPRFETVFVTVVVEIENIFGEYKYHLFSILVCLSLSSSDLFDSPSLFILYRQRSLCFSHLSLLHSFSPPHCSSYLSRSLLFHPFPIYTTLFYSFSTWFLFLPSLCSRASSFDFSPLKFPSPYFEDSSL